MKPMVAKKRTIYFFSFIAFFIVVVPVIVMHSLGYTFTKEYTIDERGGVYVFVPESGSEIYLNEEIQKTTGTFQKELFVQNLVPKSYFVLVANERFWPWAKYVDVTKQHVSPLYPFLVLRNIELRDIVKATSTNITTATAPKSEYDTILALFTEKKSDTKIDTKNTTTTPEFFGITKKNTKVWVDGNIVFAKWLGSENRIPPFFCEKDVCSDMLKVFEATSPIRHVDFYPNRDDAVIIAISDGVFAIELDTRPYHNFYPLFKGKNPDFRLIGEAVYIKDGTMLGQIKELQ